MARRRNTGFLDDLIEIAAMLPWWCCLLGALFSYLLLHYFATREIAVATSMSQFGTLVVDNLIKTFASLFQYIFPFIFCIGALVSYSGRRKRQNLMHTVANNPSRTALGEMSWQEFELLVGEAFRQEGYQVQETGGGGADGGIDLVLKRGNERFLVQGKQWRAYKVSVNVVRELFGVMAAQNATGGFVVTSGEYTAEAINFAEGRNIILIDGPVLKQMLDHSRADLRQMQAHHLSASNIRPPVCPKCGALMVKRIAKKGKNAGGAFWGCSSYPDCPGMRPFEKDPLTN